MDYKVNWDLKDGKLDSQTGRIIIYANLGIKSNGPSMDHNDLITAFAAKFKANRSEVASNGHRFYWRPISKGLINISPTRKLDEDYIDNHPEEFKAVIGRLFK